MEKMQNVVGLELIIVNFLNALLLSECLVIVCEINILNLNYFKHY